jgi:hypothetical protein
MGHFRDFLSRHKQSKKTTKLQTLRRSFKNLKMKDSESIDQFMTQMMNVVNQLRTHGEDIIDPKSC